MKKDKTKKAPEPMPTIEKLQAEINQSALNEAKQDWQVFKSALNELINKHIVSWYGDTRIRVLQSDYSLETIKSAMQDKFIADRTAMLINEMVDRVLAGKGIREDSK